jgi:hypothetical protein
MFNEHSSMQNRKGVSLSEHQEHPARTAPNPMGQEILIRVTHACKNTAQTAGGGHETQSKSALPINEAPGQDGQAGNQVNLRSSDPQV